MDEEHAERGIKNVIIAILVLIIGGLAFTLFDVSENDGDVVTSIGEAIPDFGNSTTTEEAVSSGTDQTDETDKQVEHVSTAPTPVVSPPVAPSTPPSSDPEPVAFDPEVVIVTYTNSGFIPPVVEVEAGGSVTFINSSSKTMWVTSEDHPTAKGQIYRGFDQGRSVSSGGTYTFAFTQVGVWGYKNLNFENHLGAISVIAQQY